MLLDNLLMVIPLLLFSLDVLGKIAVGHSIRTTGADLCMVAISFHFTKVVVEEIANVALTPPTIFIKINTIAHILALLCVIFWLMSLVVTGEKVRDTLSNKGIAMAWLGPGLGFLLGMLSLYTVIFILKQIAVSS